jgi:hypothetical protein
MVSSATCHRPGGDPSRAGVRLGALCKQLRRAAAPHLAQQRSAGASQSDAAAAPSLRGFSADSQPARAQIAAHYRRWGFAVVRGLLPAAEAAAVAAASQRLIERAPSERGGALDAQGRPCPDSAAYSFTDPVKADDARTYLHAGQQFVLNRINSPLPMAEPLRVMCAPPTHTPSSSSHRAAHAMPVPAQRPGTCLQVRQPPAAGHGPGHLRQRLRALRREPRTQAAGLGSGLPFPPGHTPHSPAITAAKLYILPYARDCMGALWC